MGYESLKNIIDWNKEQANLHQVDQELENNTCPFDTWELDINSKGERSCPICGRIFNGQAL
jgi:hypothetical protein